MKSCINKLWKYLAAAVLGVLGFSSCGEIIEPAGMYGSPYADFKALGSVKDENGKPIEGIKVKVNRYVYSSDESDKELEWIDKDSTYTDVKGTYSMSKRVWPPALVETKIFFEDIDGPAHGGEFLPAEVIPETTHDKESTGSWNHGTIEAKADVVLKKK